MSIAQLLRYFEREDVSELVLQTGRPCSVRVGTEYRAVSRTNLTTPEIESTLEGTPLAMAIPLADTVFGPSDIVVGERAYSVRGARRGDAVQVRISRTAVQPRRSAPPPPAKKSMRPPAGKSTPKLEIATGPIGRKSVPPPGRKSVPPGRKSVPPARTSRASRAPKTDGALDAILVEARRRGATDVHVVGGRPVLVRMGGELLPEGDPLDAPHVESMLLALLGDEHRRVFDARGYVDLAVTREGAGRARVNVSRQRTGLKGSFRLVMDPLPTIASLGLPADVGKATGYHQGLVVVAGPSGHGKTTTLAAIVDQINATRPHHVLTVEEPIEYLHPKKKAVVSQREVGLHTKSFATALKASLREDPDVIVIGELRDRETVEIAMTAAETGHLVLATMSTASAAKTIDRLIDLFPPADQPQVRSTLAGALKLVVAQRLVPTVDERVAPAIELMTGTPALWALIRDNKLFQLPNLQQRGRAFGILRLDESLAELARTGRIDVETALRFADNPKELENVLRGAAQAQPQAAPNAPQQPAQPRLGDIASRARGLFRKE